MPFRYKWYTAPLPQPLQAALTDLIVAIFNDQTPTEAAEELAYQQNRTPLLIGLAFANDVLIGYKIGYERQPGQFYSWLGGVLPEYRGRGIASALMEQQHDWCRQNGYHSIRTHTYNRWRSMLILNLRHGFDVIGTVQGRRGLLIMLEKVIS